MYSIVWKYLVKPEQKEKFELEYGKHGTWYDLFSKSTNYMGSFLHKSNDHPNDYLLIDTWSDRQSYEAFKEFHKTTYETLSATFEQLYEKEEKIGEYIAL